MHILSVDHGSLSPFSLILSVRSLNKGLQEPVEYCRLYFQSVCDGLNGFDLITILESFTCGHDVWFQFFLIDPARYILLVYRAMAETFYRIFRSTMNLRNLLGFHL